MSNLDEEKVSGDALHYFVVNYGEEINEILAKIADLIAECDGSVENARNAAEQIGTLSGDLTGIGFIAGKEFTELSQNSDTSQ